MLSILFWSVTQCRGDIAFLTSSEKMFVRPPFVLFLMRPLSTPLLSEYSTTNRLILPPSHQPHNHMGFSITVSQQRRVKLSGVFYSRLTTVLAASLPTTNEKHRGNLPLARGLCTLPVRRSYPDYDSK